MDSLELVTVGFRIFTTFGFVVGIAAGLWAIWRGHIGKGLVACVFCVPYTYFMLFEPSIRPTNMLPKGSKPKNLMVMALVIAAVLALLYVQFVNPPLPSTE